MYMAILQIECYSIYITPCIHCYFVTALFLVSLLSFSFSLPSLLLMMPDVNKLIYTVGPLYPRVPHPRIRRTDCTAPFYARALPIRRFWFLQMLNIFIRALNICRFGGPGNNPPWIARDNCILLHLLACSTVCTNVHDQRSISIITGSCSVNGA